MMLSSVQKNKERAIHIILELQFVSHVQGLVNVLKLHFYKGGLLVFHFPAPSSSKQHIVRFFLHKTLYISDRARLIISAMSTIYVLKLPERVT